MITYFLCKNLHDQDWMNFYKSEYSLIPKGYCFVNYGMVNAYLRIDNFYKITIFWRGK